MAYTRMFLYFCINVISIFKQTNYGKGNGVLYADGLTDALKTTATSKNWKINPLSI